MPLRLFLVGVLLLTALGLGLVGYQATLPPRTVRVAATPEIPPQALMIDVLAASHGLPAGTLIKDGDFTRRSLRSSEVTAEVLRDTADIRASLRGALLRHYLAAGGVLTGDHILHPRDRGFLAAVLTPGSRGFSVGVDAITGDGGLIWPGDRVDVILTQQFGRDDTPRARRFVGETVMQNVRVVAVDQSIAQGAVAGSDNATGRLARTVTLEVTPQQAETVAVADRLGRITLAIRAAEGADPSSASPEPVYGGEISPALADGSAHVRVVEGKDVRDVSFQ